MDGKLLKAARQVLRDVDEADVLFEPITGYGEKEAEEDEQRRVDSAIGALALLREAVDEYSEPTNEERAVRALALITLYIAEHGGDGDYAEREKDLKELGRGMDVQFIFKN